LRARDDRPRCRPATGTSLLHCAGRPDRLGPQPRPARSGGRMDGYAALLLGARRQGRKPGGEPERTASHPSVRQAVAPSRTRHALDRSRRRGTGRHLRTIGLICPAGQRIRGR
jgi:hypothetical protein